MKEITIHYYASLRDLRGCAQETLSTEAESALQLFDELQRDQKLPSNRSHLKLAINDEFQAWETSLRSGDRVAFLPPFAGG